jgi:hypothetical protein
VDYDGAVDGNLMRLVHQGPVNYWIDTTINALKYMRVDGSAYNALASRSSLDLAGPLQPRTGSTYTTGAFQSSSNVLNGAFGGSYYLAEGWGNVDDFEELAADFSLYDPVSSSTDDPPNMSPGGAVGLVFNMRVCTLHEPPPSICSITYTDPALFS